VSTAVTAVPASIAKNVDTAIDGLTRAFVNKELRQERATTVIRQLKSANFKVGLVLVNFVKRAGLFVKMRAFSRF
jgi:hypothetical protein